MPTTEKIMTLVFNIRTLVTDDALKEGDKKYLLRKSGGVIKAGGHEHWVLPGALTLMQYLFSKPDISVAFFNDYPKERSDALTETFLRMALGSKQYEVMAHHVRVLCENDLTTPTDAERRKQRREYEDLDWKTKKNIVKALPAHNKQSDVILIEVTPEYVMLDQEDQFICSPYSSMEGLHWKTWQLKVDEWLGRSEVFTPINFKKINTVYYLAGVLEECMRRFRAGDPVYNFLFQFNFERRRCESSYKYMEPKPIAYYVNGLRALEGFASGVRYVTEDDYKELTLAPLTEAEVEVLRRGESKMSGMPFVEYHMDISPKTASRSITLVSVFKQSQPIKREEHKATREQQHMQAKNHPKKTKHSTQGNVHPRRGNQR